MRFQARDGRLRLDGLPRIDSNRLTLLLFGLQVSSVSMSFLKKRALDLARVPMFTGEDAMTAVRT